MITALVVRRFNVKQDDGTASNVEVEGFVDLDLPTPPPHGVTLVFKDGTGEATIVVSRVDAWASPHPAGVGHAYEIRTSTEPGSRLQRVLNEPAWKRRQEA